jgi:YVTN family beta-propeller protein
MNLNFLLPAAVITLLLSGCEKTENPVPADMSKGVYVVNEGTFMANNGSITYYNPETGETVSGVFESANNRVLGDVVQSFSVVGDTCGYIVVNGSGKLEIVRLKDFKSTSPPIAVDYPRFFLQTGSEKGYLSSGSMEGTVYVINLLNRSIEDSIAVGYGPEGMLLRNNTLLVANSGGWGVDSTLSMINTETDEVTAIVQVGKVPIDMVFDSEDYLWVYCKGYAAYSWDPPYDLISETDALLQKVNTETGEIVWQQPVGKAGDYTATPPRIAISADGQTVYYLRPDGLYKLDALAPQQGVIFVPGSFYGLDINPGNGDIYLFEASFTGNGTMHIHNSNGTMLSEVVVGIAPSSAVFHLQ